ncbi:MAG TPA: hypothetical protein VGR47_12255 [Terracidiphilus sp.]|nr:hypothetical protein [Terracidiphilus sp.]
MAVSIDRAEGFLVLTIGAPVLIFGILNGALMCFAPKKHTGLWRKWYRRVGNPAWKLDSGPQSEYRIAGFVITAGCIFLGWKLTEVVKRFIH